MKHNNASFSIPIYRRCGKRGNHFKVILRGGRMITNTNEKAKPAMSVLQNWPEMLG